MKATDWQVISGEALGTCIFQGFGPVSFDDGVLAATRKAGLRVIAAGCPMMYAPLTASIAAPGLFCVSGRIPLDIDVPVQPAGLPTQ